MGVGVGSLNTNVFVTLLVAVMVFIMPLVDWLVCRHLGLNLQEGVSTNPKADELMRLRQGVLLLIFGVYLAAVSYLVFFSRDAYVDYLVHTVINDDVFTSVDIDLGILELFVLAFKEGVPAALSHIHFMQPFQISEIYLNVMLFVPMGYLLPYVSEWFRDRVQVAPVVASFIGSFIIENVQLVTKRGYYDVNDLINNTLGGFIGQTLFILVAYVLTHPRWRHDIVSTARWYLYARGRTLYPFLTNIALPRATILATDEEAVWDFYVTKLGLRLRKQTVPLDSAGTSFLLGMGKSGLVIHCSNEQEELPKQYVTISVKRLPALKKRLEEDGIKVSDYEPDVFTDHRSISFEGPDGVRITVVED